jgi:LacI family transcriptional regulator
VDEARLGDDALVDLWIPELTFGRDAGERLLGLSPRPTAVFCGNDLVALGILQIMTERGVRVPEHLAIVGYDDIELAGRGCRPADVRAPVRMPPGRGPRDAPGSQERSNHGPCC